MLLWQKASGRGKGQTLASSAYNYDHYDEWRRVGAPPRRLDEGCRADVITSVDSLRRSMRHKRTLPRSLQPLYDAPLLRQTSDQLPQRPKDASRLAQTLSTVVLPPLERQNDPTTSQMPREHSNTLNLDSCSETSASTPGQTERVDDGAPASPIARSGNFSAPPPVEGLIPPEEIWSRWNFDGAGFTSVLMGRRIRQAFDLFKLVDSSEIMNEDLLLAVQHLGYFALTPEAVAERAKEVTEYSAMNLEEFTAFLEKYAVQEQADLTHAFQRHAKHSKVPQKALLPLLHEIGFTSLQRSVFETLTATRLTMKALTLPHFFRFLAAHSASEGFTSAQLRGARKAFDQVRAGKDEIAPQGVGSALAQFFGQDAYEKWYHLWQRMRGENRPEDEEQQVWKTPLVDFHDFLGMARALQVEELSELHARFQLADQDQDGAVVEGEFLSLLPEDAALLVCGKVHTLLLDAQIQAGQLMSFDDVFDVLSLCRTTSNFTKFEVEELNQAFTRFDEDNSGKIDVLEMVEMLLYMGFNSSLEHVHEIIIQSDVDGNSELDFSEFLHVMATHELTHTKAVRNAFRKMTSRSKTCTQDQMSFLLQSLGYFPGETVFEEMLAEDGLNDVQDFDFTMLRSVTGRCRRHLAKVARSNAYFPETHIHLLWKLFQEQLLPPATKIERGGLVCLLQILGVSMNTLQERDAILQMLDAARTSAELAGADIPSPKEGNSITFPVMLHLLRAVASHGQMTVMRRELKAMKDAQVSHAEVVEFRQVFNQLALEAKAEMAEKALQQAKAVAASPGGRRRSMPDLSAMMPTPALRGGMEHDVVFQELKASLFIGGKALCISVHAVIGMLRSLGVRISEKQLLELTNKVRDFAAIDRAEASQEETVDFAAFLRVIRWMLDVNFGDINARAAARLGSRTKQMSRSRSAHVLDSGAESQEVPRMQRRRASIS